MSRYVVASSPKFRAVTIDGQTRITSHPGGRGPAGPAGPAGDVPAAIGEAVADEINTPGTAANDALLAALAEGTPDLPASKTTSGVFARARLGTGTADASKVLFGDGTWKDAPSGGGSTVTETATDGLYEIGAGA